MLIKANWPVYDKAADFPDAVENMELAMTIIRSIRNIRAEAEAGPSRKLRAVILPEAKKKERLEAILVYVKHLGNLTEINVIESKTEVPEEVMSAVVDGVEIFIPLDDLLDYPTEFARLKKEEARLESDIQRLKAKLDNPGFVGKAPEQVVAVERDKLAQNTETLEKIRERIVIVEKKL
jgi:valyl-tRNA synthetase